MNAIRCTDLTKQYAGGTLALSELNLEVEEGTVFGFLGPNGAGKTTTVRVLNGTLSPSSGSFTLFSNGTDSASIRGMSATLSETAKMYENLSAMENLRFFGSLYGMGHSETESRAADLLRRIGLGGRENGKVGTYSTGMKKRLQLARTLLHRPKILFLDEPTSGLDPEAANEVTDLIRELSGAEGTTVFLCTHNLAMAERVCDRVGFMQNGSLIASGSREELARRLGRSRNIEIRLLDPSRQTETTQTHPVRKMEDINRYLKSAMEDGLIVLESRLPEPGLEELYFAYIGENNETK